MSSVISLGTRPSACVDCAGCVQAIYVRHIRKEKAPPPPPPLRQGSTGNGPEGHQGDQTTSRASHTRAHLARMQLLLNPCALESQPPALRGRGVCRRHGLSPAGVGGRRARSQRARPAHSRWRRPLGPCIGGAGAHGRCRSHGGLEAHARRVPVRARAAAQCARCCLPGGRGGVGRPRSTAVGLGVGLPSGERRPDPLRQKAVAPGRRAGAGGCRRASGSRQLVHDLARRPAAHLFGGGAARRVTTGACGRWVRAYAGVPAQE